MSAPCVFFDRDGVVNERPTAARYVRSLGEFHLIPDFLDALRVVLRKGYKAIIVTNQKGVATGAMSQQAVDEIHSELRAVVRAAGLHLSDIMVCTAASDADPRRKPNPGMLLEAAALHDLDLSRSWMVGDNEKDVEAGRRAGCRTILVSDSQEPTRADYRVETVRSLVQLLEKVLPQVSKG